MAANDPITASAPRALRAFARRAMWRLAPAYGRRRAQRAADASSLRRLREDLDHLSERHDERLERLEELARELVLTAEALRREIDRPER